MFFAHLIFAFVAAVIFSIIVAGLTGWRHPADRSGGVAGPVLFVFLVLFLTSWVGGFWFRPIGPTLWGASWLSSFLVALFVVLILLAIAAPPRRSAAGVEASEATTEAVVFGGFFWLLTIALLAAILAGHLL